MLKNWHISSVCLIILMLASCRQNQVFNSSKAIDQKGWHKDSILSFTLPTSDTLKPHNLFINIRNTNTYPFSNLYLIAQLNHPNGKQKIDTIQYQMAKPNGEWLGTGATSIKENKLWYLENFQFTENGQYSINIQHAMRANGNTEGIIYLKGISDVGIQIETASEQQP